MKRFSEQFNNKAQQIRLTTAEKTALESRLRAYMEYHPLAADRQGQATVTPREPFLAWAKPQGFYWQLAVGCLLFVVVGVPLLAERAIPGDPLYLMKVQFNEEVRGSLTTSGYEKVVWETKRLERRIAEARLLAKEGKLTPEVEAGVVAAVNAHQVATEAEIASLRTTDADGAALAEMTVLSVLDVQSAALKAESGSENQTPNPGKSTGAIAMALSQAQVQVGQKINDAAPVSYERIVAQLEQETTRSRELLLSLKDSATDQEYSDIERRLGDVERKLAKGTELYTTNAEAGKASLKQTWRDMQVIRTFMTDINVRSSLTIETMVPVVLTPEEENTLATTAYAEAVADLETINATLPTVTDKETSKKAAVTVVKIKELLNTASTTIAVDAKGAKSAADEAHHYAQELIQLPAFSGQGMATGTASTTVNTPTATTTETVIEIDLPKGNGQ